MKSFLRVSAARLLRTEEMVGLERAGGSLGREYEKSSVCRPRILVVGPSSSSLAAKAKDFMPAGHLRLLL